MTTFRLPRRGRDDTVTATEAAKNFGALVNRVIALMPVLPFDLDEARAHARLSADCRPAASRSAPTTC
jgi:hypothetical protein